MVFKSFHILLTSGHFLLGGFQYLRAEKFNLCKIMYFHEFGSSQVNGIYPCSGKIKTAREYIGRKHICCYNFGYAGKVQKELHVGGFM